MPMSGSLLAQVMLKLDKLATCAKFKPLTLLAHVMLMLDKYGTCAKFKPLTLLARVCNSCQCYSHAIA